MNCGNLTGVLSKQEELPYNVVYLNLGKYPDTVDETQSEAMT
jgi:hypothetical protein